MTIFPTPASAPLYLLLIPLFCLFYCKSQPHLARSLCLTLCLKVLYSFLMLYLVVERWDYGDLQTYYVKSQEIALSNFSDFDQVYGSLIVSVIHAVFFIILGPSLIGLAIVAACFSHLGLSWIALAVGKSHPLSLNRKAIYLIHFLPFIGMQSTYIGKEPWVLLLTGIVFQQLANQKLKILVIILALIAMIAIRPYHGFILSVATFIYLLFSNGFFSKKSIVVLAVMSPFIFKTAQKFFALYTSISELGLKVFLASSYGSGRQILEVYQFPLTPLQLFRPLPWESQNFILFASSIENFFVLLLLVASLNLYFELPKKKIGASVDLTFFMVVFSIIYGGLFMFSENIGDLSRRHVYFYPLIILLWHYNPKPLFKVKFGRLDII